jgi:chromosome segregation ATPase
MKKIVGMTLFGCLMGLALGFVGASEEDELRERAERNRQEARKSSESEADRLRQEAEELERHAQIQRERAAREHARNEGGRERELSALRERLQDLHRMQEVVLQKLGEDHPQSQAIRRQIAVLEEEQRELSGHPHRPREESARKIEHLHAAAEHLEEAGNPDMARELRKQAENLERELRNRRPEEPEGQEMLRQLGEQMRDMKQEIETLRDEVKVLREELSVLLPPQPNRKSPKP